MGSQLIYAITRIAAATVDFPMMKLAPSSYQRNNLGMTRRSQREGHSSGSWKLLAVRLVNRNSNNVRSRAT